MWNLHDLLAKERESGERKGWKMFNVTGLPGWAYARALALRQMENGDKSSNDSREIERPSDIALREAIISFPSVVPLVADKADISLPSNVRADRRYRVEPNGRYAFYLVKYYI